MAFVVHICPICPGWRLGWLSKELGRPLVQLLRKERSSERKKSKVQLVPFKRLPNPIVRTSLSPRCPSPSVYPQSIASISVDPRPTTPESYLKD
ncbi:hypothetical protein YC2023_004561 [Brassica napus]